MEDGLSELARRIEVTQQLARTARELGLDPRRLAAEIAPFARDGSAPSSDGPSPREVLLQHCV